MNKLYLVGIGPGDPAQLTPQAHMALSESDLLCGYGVYLDLIAPLFPGKPTLSTPMRQELRRCRLALDAAAEGKTVSMLCSGDPGVYGMAGPVLELAPDYPEVEIAVVPGITAALSGAAELGAPLMHDFCVLSLSDLLTPWAVIERRLQAAALGDFVLCLYNPGSHRRQGHLRKACEILLNAGKSPETPCGWVRNIGRPGTEKGIFTLKELSTFSADMFTTVFIGNSQTAVKGGRLVTPRGYATHSREEQL